MDSGFPDVTAHIARRLREEREARGLSRNDVAAALGVARASIYRFEREDTSVNAVSLWAVCSALGIDPGCLFPPLDERLRKAE